jgi:hypothetical protein
VSTAVVLLAMALWIGPGPLAVRVRAGASARVNRPRPEPSHGPDPLAVASSLDVLAVCLTAGMAVSTAAAATAASSPPKLARVLRRTAELLALGADPAVAWSTPPDLPAGSVDAQTDALLRWPTVSPTWPTSLATPPHTRPRLPPSGPGF